MDLLGVTEMFVERTCKATTAEVNLGLSPDTYSLALTFSDLTLSP